MSASEAIKGIRHAAKQRARAERARREAIEALREHCRWAQAEGVPLIQIAQEARLSRQDVYELLSEGHPLVTNASKPSRDG